MFKARFYLFLLLLLPVLLTFTAQGQGNDTAKKLFNKGYHYMSVDRTQAIDYLTQCLEIDSAYTEAFLHRGIAFFKEEKFMGALSDFNNVYKLDPQLSITWLYKGFTYRNMGQLDNALSCFSRYITLNPQDTSAYSHIIRGKMKYELGDFSGAVKDYDMAMKLKPLEEKYQYYRFVALYDNGIYKQALQAVTNLIEINSDFYGYYFYKGNVFMKMEQLDSAISMYNISVLKNYNNADGYFYRAQAYHKQGHLTKALEDYNTAVMLNPDDAVYYSKRGNCKMESNDKNGACEDWSDAGSLGYYEDFDKVKKVCQ